MRNNIQKIIITITMIVLVFCVVYVPWQAEYKGKVEFLGYHVSWNKPAIYTKDNFARPNPSLSGDKFIDSLPFNSYDEEKASVVKKQGYTIYPSWVKDFAVIDYKRIVLNCIVVILVGGVSYVISTITKKK
ncbi:hypothetical protein [Pectinatus frisingensis]|uniref:hypothetical protein n=1 Tax=Pectinatus frisingensis TaxID=865 RepID=UPI0018C51335|nr:hypothetical protein [Pectinatus frisingensis]